MRSKVGKWALDSFPSLNSFVERLERHLGANRAVLVSKRGNGYFAWSKNGTEPVPVVVEKLFENYPYPPMVYFTAEGEVSALMSRTVGVGFPFFVFKRDGKFLVVQGSVGVESVPLIEDFIFLAALFLAVEGSASPSSFTWEYFFKRVKPALSSLVNFAEFLAFSGEKKEEGLRNLLEMMRDLERLFHRCKLLHEYKRGIRKVRGEKLGLGSLFERLRHSFLKTVESHGGRIEAFYGEDDFVYGDPDVLFSALYEVLSFLVNRSPSSRFILRGWRKGVVVEMSGSPEEVTKAAEDEEMEFVLSAAGEFTRVLGGEVHFERGRERLSFFFEIS